MRIRRQPLTVVAVMFFIAVSIFLENRYSSAQINETECQPSFIFTAQNGTETQPFIVTIGEQPHPFVPSDYAGDGILTGVTPSHAENLVAVVFSTNPGGIQEVFLTDADSIIQDTVVELANSTILSIEWSPDGHRLALAAIIDGQSRILLVDLDTKVVRFTELEHSVDNLISFGGWSPDSSKIAYVVTDREMNNYRFLAYYDLDTHTSEALTQATHYDDFLTWSPDSEYILFGSNRNDDHLALYRVSLQSREVELISAHHTPFASWSPDMTQLVFMSYDGQQRQNLYSLDYATLETRPILPDGTINHENYARVDWSPDGTAIAYESFTSQSNYEIFSVSPSGENIVQLTSSPANNVHPRWLGCPIE